MKYIYVCWIHSGENTLFIIDFFNNKSDLIQYYFFLYTKIEESTTYALFETVYLHPLKISLYTIDVCYLLNLLFKF